ncbi:GNAT family N-acetyltransferase [Martelella endophytica]|uniref:N-acetyltransferase domain-containing protein n=1 Tax=Martelella endophytica TaxID=1486262 RepID=A0A0D5LMU8_MAREN|nr:GNAT family N-acetyltransferase [Martelella endophytica]AJY44638.1 hypothetical protein TM49_01370 [Martelella endophytica]
MTAEPFIRRARPEDRQALFDICLKTADSGGDASALYSDPDYPGLVWAVPYLEFSPDFCFVVDVDGTAMGYIVGTPDTAAFEQRLDEAWWPRLRRRYAECVVEKPLDGNVLSYITAPRYQPVDIARRYPAHLHINLLPPLQSGGWGRRLIATELEALTAAGARGVHLGVSRTNENAQGFYSYIGLTRQDREDGLWFVKALD